MGSFQNRYGLEKIGITGASFPTPKILSRACMVLGIWGADAESLEMFCRGDRRRQETNPCH